MLRITIFREFSCYFIVLILLTVLSAKGTPHQTPAQCGIRKISKTELIVAGSGTKPGEWPWHVAVYHRKDTSEKYACGGTLISAQFVLTAAHCVIDPGNRQQLVKERIFIRLGFHNLLNWNGNFVRQHLVYGIYKHPNYTSNAFKNDIAILKLATLAEFNDFVQPACLNRLDNLTGQYGTVIGWGVTEADLTSNELKSARMPVIDSIACLTSDRKVFGETLDQGIFCAGYTNGTTVCNGDSGGGIFFEKGNAWYLGGIVSYTRVRDGGSKLCHTSSYGAFTKVHTYLPWISSVTHLKLDSYSCESKDVDPSKTYANLLPRDCGRYITNRIIRGSKTNVFDFPWMALIEYKQLYGVGTLIHKRYVLTNVAIAQVKDELIAVRLGEHTIDQDRDCSTIDGEIICAPPAENYGVDCIITHKNFDNRTHLHDIALIRLDRDVQFEDHIQPICLPVTDDLKTSNPQKYIVTGWGRTELGTWSKELRQGIVTPAEPSACQEWLDKVGLKLDKSQLCVGQPDGSDACSGDGGGPLGYSAKYWLYGTRFVQFGITSYGSPDCHGLSIYTNVAYYMDWIKANMEP